MSHTFFILGAVFALIGVAAGAFGAHTLRDMLTTHYLHVFETGVRYQMYHAFALIFTAWALDKYNDTYFRFAGWVFTAGIILFSGSLYILALTGTGWLGAITPFGGVLFLAGWLLLIIGFFSSKKA